jgi:hypothetical protein
MIKHTAGWTKAKQILGTAAKKLAQAGLRATLQEAQFFRTKVIEGLREQAPGGRRFRPLSPLTLAMRRAAGFSGTKALLRGGDLRNSIQVVKRGEGVFVGVLRTAVGRTGQPLFDVAELHEFGAGPFVIEVTDEMLAFLHASLRESGTSAAPSGGTASLGFIVVKIPARPFLRPVFEKFGRAKDVRARFEERVARLLGLELGSP